jgi:tetratricopeptide (TPR) repeat protein
MFMAAAVVAFLSAGVKPKPDRPGRMKTVFRRPAAFSGAGRPRRVRQKPRRFGLRWRRRRINLAGKTGRSFQSMATPAELNSEKKAQLMQTIEMFEVIVQSQPGDTQSLEILKEAYSKLGLEKEVIHTSKRIAQAYLQQGQLSSAILEYETVLQRQPDDEDVRAALNQIEERASSAVIQPATDGGALASVSEMAAARPHPAKAPAADKNGVDDGRRSLHKIFVEGKLITAGDFDLCWRNVDLSAAPADVVEPFIGTLYAKGIVPLEQSLRLLSDKSRIAYLPLNHYDVDMELTRSFPATICRRWCVLPFDRMSKSVLVATANPFNQQAAKELAAATPHRLLWYVATPNDLVTHLRNAFH